MMRARAGATRNQQCHRTGQQELFTSAAKRRGGKRKGAGRKPNGQRAGTTHEARPVICGRHPLHVVLRATPEVGNLRRRAIYHAIREATVVACVRERIRIVQLSIQRTHLHLLVEADSTAALSRGLQGFQISVARNINSALRRSVSPAPRPRIRRSLSSRRDSLAEAGAQRSRVHHVELAPPRRGSQWTGALVAGGPVLERVLVPRLAGARREAVLLAAARHLRSADRAETAELATPGRLEARGDDQRTDGAGPLIDLGNSKRRGQPRLPAHRPVSDEKLSSRRNLPAFRNLPRPTRRAWPRRSPGAART